MMANQAQCWNMPEKGDRPALTIVVEDGKHPYAIGDKGPRPLTNDEYMRWTQFKVDLARRY